MHRRIEDYALLSDCRSSALVSSTGSIDWMCCPRFDSAACFAQLLGTANNGYWAITPQVPFSSSRQYLGNSWILQTRFATKTGVCTLQDAWVIGEPRPRLVRLLQGVEGEVAVGLDLVIRFEYGSVIPWVRRLHNGYHGVRAVAGPDRLTFESPVPLNSADSRVSTQFTVARGQTLSFSMVWSPSTEGPDLSSLPDPIRAMGRTSRWWEDWSKRCQHEGNHAKAVLRSLLTLKALTYEPTGGIIAAPTTSLPERLGGSRNWDYRYCWLRDSTFALYSLLNAGYRDEAEKWKRWLLRAVAGTASQVHILYGLSGERRLPEFDLSWLAGYEGSRPVRIGNAAYTQLQLDIYGEIMDTLELARRHDLPSEEEDWKIQREMIEYLARRWTEPDEGIWEVRGSKRHFTQSKVMAWVAVDRSIRAISDHGLSGPLEEWVVLRKRIKEDVLRNGFSTKRNCFVQYYGSEELDASLLMLGLVGFLPPDDPRLVGTVDAIQKHLMRDGLVQRYDTSKSIDGLEGEEGAFLACSFWLADNLFLLNRKEEAKALFEQVSALANDVGLFSEEYCPKHKRMLGNFPQAFSHIAHINTATNLYGRIAPASDRSSGGTRKLLD